MESSDLISLIEAYDLFQKETQEADLVSFACWLKRGSEVDEEENRQIDRDLGYAINRVNRFSKLFARHYLNELPINSLEEFSFITAINSLGSPSKSKVYDSTLTELATGQQMMRRLIKEGLVEEMEDDFDKRIKRVTLTKKGKDIQREAFKRIGEECYYKFDGLDFDSKKELLKILNVLIKSLEKKRLLGNY